MCSVQLWNAAADGNCSTDHTLDNKRNHGDPCKNRGEARAFMSFKVNLGFAVRKEEKKEIPVPELTLLTPEIMNLKEESGSTGSRTNCSRAVPCSVTSARSNLRSVPLHISSSSSSSSNSKPV
ncbi:hypothetical protein HRI_003536200 [Hibiscus trionum]|uniref:Uncharacterized protein n=1 Tax=Hibiscus trionum TaxID=183268 RepID=A0A9W7IL94_HIBTR|nr:hypothetical protein HRI_003536200 [Hibiscus trionum]